MKKIIPIFVFTLIYSMSALADCHDQEQGSNGDCESDSQDEVSWKKDHEILKFSRSSKIQSFANEMDKKASTGWATSKGKCNLYVVEAVRKFGLPAWTGENAYYAVQVHHIAGDLGYKNLLDKYPDMTPLQAPKGAILVYSGPPSPNCSLPEKILKSHPELGPGQNGCGHVEVRTSYGFASDYKDKGPVSDNNKHKLLGIYILPADEL